MLCGPGEPLVAVRTRALTGRSGALRVALQLNRENTSMMTPRKDGRILLLLAAVLGFTAAPALAHHSFAMFDRQKVMTVEGVVKQLTWTNPHVLIDVNVPEKEGASGQYRIECASINILMREGWKVSSIKPGDRITIEFNPLKSGLPGGLLIAATLANGTVLKQ